MPGSSETPCRRPAQRADQTAPLAALPRRGEGRRPESILVQAEIAEATVKVVGTASLENQQFWGIV